MEEDFATFHGIEISVARFIIKNKEPRCSCGRFKKIIKHKQSRVGLALFGTCGKRECNPKFGSKRPEHSEKMKALAAGQGSAAYLASLMKAGELYNKGVNTIEFKRKVLSNKGYDVDTISDDDVLTLHGKFLGDIQKDRTTRTKIILTKMSKWEDEFICLAKELVGLDPIDKITLDSLSDDSFSSIYSKLHGIQSVINSVKSENTGRCTFFKSIFIEDLKYNTQGKTTVRTRSGLEAEYIHLFERECIPWSFEELRIITTDCGGLYIPDFVIQYNGETYIVEAKGGFFRQEKDNYISNKILAGAKYAKERGWKFCMTFSSPKTMKFLETSQYF